MKCFKLDNTKIAVPGVDLSAYSLCDGFKNPKKVTTAALQFFIKDPLISERLITTIKEHSSYDAFLHAVTFLVPGDSESKVIPKDCLLVQWNLFDYYPDRSVGDKSMQIACTDKTCLSLCYSGETFIKCEKTGKHIINDKGTLKVLDNASKVIDMSDGFVYEF